MKKAYTNLSRILTTWLIALTLTACGPDDFRKIDGKLSDVESEILTRWDNQRNINREWNIYIKHLWKWDELQISEMEKGSRERAEKNRKKYNKLLEKRDRLLKERDEAIASYKWNNNNYYNEHELENSDAAIREAIQNRNN